jgi:hypothetical protein
LDTFPERVLETYDVNVLLPFLLKSPIAELAAMFEEFVQPPVPTPHRLNPKASPTERCSPVRVMTFGVGRVVTA